jgi:hypothetical protein
VLLGLVTATTLAFADSEIYKWVDEEGNVHYSDCPPPPACDAETIQAPDSPDPADVRRAQERLDEMLVEQQASKGEREQERLEKERQEVLAMRVAVAKKQVCIRARQNLYVLRVQKPVFYLDANGEYVYLDEATRQAEILRMKQLVAENCEPATD